MAWSWRRRRAVWLASAFAGGLAVGPLANLFVRRAAADLARSLSWFTAAVALLAAAILGAFWFGFARLTEDLFGLRPRRCRRSRLLGWIRLSKPCIESTTAP
jgi:hypothetical protein